MCAANFLADLTSFTLLVSFAMILGAFLGQVARDAALRRLEAKAAPAAA